jgi:hypothetical protein
MSYWRHSQQQPAPSVRCGHDPSEAATVTMSLRAGRHLAVTLRLGVPGIASDEPRCHWMLSANLDTVGIPLARPHGFDDGWWNRPDHRLRASQYPLCPVDTTDTRSSSLTASGLLRVVVGGHRGQAPAERLDHPDRDDKGCGSERGGPSGRRKPARDHKHQLILAASRTTNGGREPFRAVRQVPMTDGRRRRRVPCQAGRWWLVPRTRT